MARKKPSRNACAVVTGAGSGIGRAFALMLAERGGRVVCSDINLLSARATADRIIAKAGRISGESSSLANRMIDRG